MSATVPGEFVDFQQVSEKQNAVGDGFACPSGNPSCRAERGCVEHVNENGIEHAGYRKEKLP